jgi:hypothetical protein
MSTKDSLRLTDESQNWLAILGTAVGTKMPPLVSQVLAQSVRPGRQLPLWLEPEIDYQAGIVYTARDPRGQLPSRGVRAHETVHWALEHLPGATPRRLGLEGMCDAGAALLTGDPVILSPVAGLTRDLRRPAFNARADLSTQALFARVLEALEQTSDVAPRLLETLRRERDRAPTGGAGMTSVESLAVGHRGLVNVLRHLGILSGTVQSRLS